MRDKGKSQYKEKIVKYMRPFIKEQRVLIGKNNAVRV
jgi:hypothetical protein